MNKQTNVVCECGSVVNCKYLEKHKKTKLHRNKMSIKESRHFKKITGNFQVCF